MTIDIKRAICALFEVHPDERGMHRVVTPLEFTGSGDRIVVRVRPLADGWQIDENGEAAFMASMLGGDVESEAMARWLTELSVDGPVVFGEDEVLKASTNDDRLIVPYIFRVAEAAQRLHAVATAKQDRKQSDFKEQVKSIVLSVASALNVSVQEDAILPIVGGMTADYVIDTASPLILIAASSPTRLLEAELIHMQYQRERLPGQVIAIAESQAAVGRRQFERAAYFTSRTLAFSKNGLEAMLRQDLAS